MIVQAQIYIGNMSERKQTALMGLSPADLEAMTTFKVANVSRDDCLATWELMADEESPAFAGEAFVREDFVAAILDIVEEVK